MTPDFGGKGTKGRLRKRGETLWKLDFGVRNMLGEAVWGYING
jgi:hypothetical protein